MEGETQLQTQREQHRLDLSGRDRLFGCVACHSLGRLDPIAIVQNPQNVQEKEAPD